MPIDLTTVPEGSGSHRPRSRRRSRRDKQRWHSRLAIAAGVGALALLAAILVLVTNDGGGRSTVTNSNYDNGFLTTRDPVTADKAGAPPEVTSAPAVSTAELPDGKAMVKLISMYRVRGADGGDSLKIEYEFYKVANPPPSYQFAVRLPGSSGVAYASFSNNASQKDTVMLPITLNKVGNRTPIIVWIESIIPQGERVSNMLKIE